mmetsp:Transcript_16459/g.22095  ORF Transcript_16459/g.22095 Transcript_16459/m.22095 type:complete len:96 (+) Transcript_16459:95-382(+)
MLKTCPFGDTNLKKSIVSTSRPTIDKNTCQKNNWPSVLYPWFSPKNTHHKAFMTAKTFQTSSRGTTDIVAPSSRVAWKKKNNALIRYSTLVVYEI